MKKKFIFIAATIMAAAGIAVAAEYHYGFILSCGKTEYYTSTRPLTDAELAERAEFYENTKCSKITADKQVDDREDLLKDKNRP